MQLADTRLRNSESRSDLGQGESLVVVHGDDDLVALAQLPDVAHQLLADRLVLQSLPGRGGLVGDHQVVDRDPEEAVARLGDDRPDLVLADMRMPHLDGYAVPEHVARHAGRAYLPVLVLTASSHQALHRALEAGRATS